MTLNHLFSPSLFEELFRHNIVACDGHILPIDEGFQKYKEILTDRSRMRTAQNFQERKFMADKLQSLMKTSAQPTREAKILLKKLGLRMTDEGTVALGKVVESQQYLGPSHAKGSLSERRVAAHKAGLKVQKRDLKQLDGWLTRISGPKVRVKKAPERTKLDWKYEESKYRAKSESVRQEMAKCRQILVKKCLSNEQHKWISDMERILEDITESKKLFYTPVKGDKEVENALAPVKGDQQVENVIAPLKSDKDAENVLAPLKDEEDNEVRRVHETESRTENLIAAAGPDDIIADFGRDGKCTGETSSESPVDDKDENMRPVPGTGSKTENRIPVAEPENGIAVVGSKGYWAEKTSVGSPVEDEDDNVLCVPRIGSKTENSIAVAEPKEITEAESDETVTLDARRQTAHYRKATPEEDNRTEESSDTRDDP